MVTRLVRFKLAGLFPKLAAKDRIGNGLGDIEFVEAWMRGLRIANRRSMNFRSRFKLIEPVIDLFDGGIESGKV